MSCVPTVATIESCGAAVMAGSVLGIVSMVRLRITGQVLGISGIVGRMTQSQVKVEDFLDRSSFLVGLVAAGTILQAVLPASFGPAWMSPVLTFMSMMRLLVAGLLVGVGTAAAKGCTSGHGILGNSRCSQRSMIATILFMLAGITTATLFQTASWRAALSSDESSHPSPLSIPTSAFLAISLALGYGLSIKFAFILLSAPRRAIDFLSALTFGLALGVAGMGNSLRVASFLDLAAFDPTLVFVMCGAIGISAPLFILWGGSTPTVKPVLSEQYSLAPRDKAIDKNLFFGSILFGCGWGLAGWCPGPAILALGTLFSSGDSADAVTPLLLFNSALLAGWALYYRAL